MVIVKIRKRNNQIERINISGHAGSGPAGYDLVCAGVSAISFGAINAIYKLVKIVPEVEQRDDGGYLDISFPENIGETEREKVQLLLEAMIVSLQTIEDEYGEYIRIKYT